MRESLAKLCSATKLLSTKGYGHPLAAEVDNLKPK